MEKRWSSFIVAAFALSAVLWTGCSRTSDTAKNDTATSSSVSKVNEQTRPNVPENRPVIVTFGDSLTAGVAGRSYPDDLQDLLDQHGYRYRVDNQGVSGDTTTDGLARIDNVIAEHPALVVLEFGGNDGLRGIPVEATKKNLEEMIGQVKQAGIPLVLLGITLPPNYGPDYVKPFTAIFPALAQQYKIPLFPFLLLHVYQDPNLMQPDGIHPNGNGNVIVARDVYQLIQPLLKKSS